jgi:hypothetical protein
MTFNSAHRNLSISVCLGRGAFGGLLSKGKRKGGRDKERPDRSRMGVDFNGSTSLPSSLKLLIILDSSVVDVLVRTRPFGFQATSNML